MKLIPKHQTYPIIRSLFKMWLGLNAYTHIDIDAMVISQLDFPAEEFLHVMVDILLTKDLY